MNRRIACLTLPLLSLLLAAPLAAGPLAERVPAEAIVYVGWAGKTAAFDASVAGRLSEDPVVTDAMAGIKAAIARAVPEGGPKAAFANGWSMLATAWKCPIAIALIDVKAPEGGQAPMPSAAMMIDLGERKDAFAEDLDRMVMALMEEPLPTETIRGRDFRVMPVGKKGSRLAYGFDGGLFLLCIGPEGLPARLLDLDKARGLAASGKYAAAVKAVATGESQLVVYEDIERLVEAFRQAGPGDAEERQTFDRMFRAMGMDRATVLVAATRFVEGGAYSKTKLFTPAPHRGLLGLAAGRPLTDADMAPVPADADYAVAANLRMEQVLDVIRDIVAAGDPDAAREMNEQIAEAERRLGISFEKDLFDALGDTWVFSTAESQGGFLTGSLLTVEVKDPRKLAATVAKIEDFFRKAFGGRDRNGEHGPTTRPASRPRIRSMKAGGADIHYVTANIEQFPMPVAPSWTVHEGRFYLALWPQVIATAIESPPVAVMPRSMRLPYGRVPSLKLAPHFGRLRGRIAERPALLAYANTGRIVERLYPLMLVGWTTGANALQQHANVDADPAWMPPLSWMKRYCGPGVMAVSTEEDGIVYEEYGRLPGIQAIANSPFFAAGAVLGLREAKKDAKKSVSMARLRCLGLGTHMYAMEYHERFPKNIGELGPYLGYEDGAPIEGLVSPLSRRKPPIIKGNRLIGETDYIYVRWPGRMSDVRQPAEMILFYERPENYGNKGTAVLFVDGHVQWMDMSAFQAALKRTQEAIKKRANRNRR